MSRCHQDVAQCRRCERYRDAAEVCHYCQRCADCCNCTIVSGYVITSTVVESGGWFGKSGDSVRQDLEANDEYNEKA
jgi:hypothetical protein